jgi:hypothetical protein
MNLAIGDILRRGLGAVRSSNGAYACVIAGVSTLQQTLTRRRYEQ